MRDDKISYRLAYLTVGTLLATCWLAGTSASAQEASSEESVGSDKTAELARAKVLTVRAEKLYQEGRYDEAISLSREALTIRETFLGEMHPDVAESLNDLGMLHKARGAYDQALSLLMRAFDIWEKALGSDHPYVAIALHNMAELHQARGEYAAALSLYERALAIWEKVLGPDHPHGAMTLNSLAVLHGARGEYNKALPLYERALAIMEKALGPDHPEVATALNNLAGLHGARREYDKALPLYARALAIWEKALEADHPNVAAALNNLAGLHGARREHDKALPLYARALAIWEKARGPDHPEVATALNNLAGLHVARGEYDNALPLYERTLAIIEKARGPDHPQVATALNNLAVLHTARDRIATAIELFERGSRIRARILGQWLHSGSEHQRHRRMGIFTVHVPLRVSLHLTMAPNNPRAARLAMEAILAYKSRILDAMADTMRAAHLDADPVSRAMLEQLRDAHAVLSHLYLQSPGGDQATQERYRQRRAEVESRIDELQATLSARSETYRWLIKPVTVAALQEQLPGDAALLEFFIYKPYDFNATGQAAVNAYGEPRYAAYIVRPGGQVYGVDLGPAEVIDEAVTRLRESFARYSKDAHERARELHALVIQPLREHLGDTTHIYLSPAGQLGFVPFAALLDERGRYLVERHSFTYLASGRDLVQRSDSTEASARESQPVTVVADPSYGVSAAADALAHTSANDSPEAAAGHRLSRDATQIGQVEALVGTRLEAEILRALWPGAVVWTRTAATETAVKNVQSPRILHLATHGFFLEDQDLETMAGLSPDDLSLQSGILGNLGVRGYRAPVENGLLRSGLLLAGANELRDPAGDNDGVLTALEVSAMNLAGTQLVILSACDTGIGENGPDQGVYGLRRAFAVAGAQTLVMSLWKVDDNATQDLMARYYRYLLAGEGRAEAMRRVQLDYLAQGGARAHPYYWAAFVVSGDDSTLAGKPPRLATVRAGGCAGCSTGDAGASASWLCALIMLMLAFVTRARRRA